MCSCYLRRCCACYCPPSRYLHWNSIQISTPCTGNVDLWVVEPRSRYSVRRAVSFDSKIETPNTCGMDYFQIGRRLRYLRGCIHKCFVGNKSDLLRSPSCTTCHGVACAASTCVCVFPFETMQSISKVYLRRDVNCK